MRAFADSLRLRHARAPQREAPSAAPHAEARDYSAARPAGRSALRNNSACACGGGCPRCLESSPQPAGPALQSPKQRPEVVVEPKTELKTPAFANDPELVKVMEGKRYVNYGHSGTYVRLIQEALLSSEQPQSDGTRTRLPKHGIDGIFGPETKAAVEEFQREYGVAADGIVGRQTLYWLDDTFRDYIGRPAPAADKNLPERFATLTKLGTHKSFDAQMKVDHPTETASTPLPEITAKVSFAAEVEGPPNDKVFFIQNIRRIERKYHWRRTEDCAVNCEEARVFLGKAQGIDTGLPYAGPFMLTGGKDKAEADDEPTMPADERYNPQGDYKKGDNVTLFAHDHFRMFIAHGTGGALDFSSFDALGFFDWEWRGKARFTFDGTTWTAGGVERRIDPKVMSLDKTSAPVFLGPLYTGEEIDRNLRARSTKIDETPASW